MAGGRNPPAEVIASWPKPNYVNPESHGNGLLIGSIFLLVITTVVVLLRLWIRVFVVRHPGLDDVLITISAIVSFGIVAIIWIKEENQANRHIWDIQPTKGVILNSTTWIGSHLCIVAFGCTKTSLLLLYRRILSRTSGLAFRWPNTITLVIVVSYSTAYLIAGIFSCQPIEAFWERFSYEPLYTRPFHCGNEGAYHTSYAILNLSTDFVITLLPIFFLHNLIMPSRQKWALCAIFGLGFFVCIVGIIRTYYIVHIYYHTYDITWPSHTVWGWNLAEVDVGIICACAPTLKPIFVKYLSGTEKSFWSPSATFRFLKRGSGDREDHVADSYPFKELGA